MTEWPVSCDPNASFGDRVAQVAISALADGKLSDTNRTDFYRQFIACGGTEHLETVKTSCAVFAGAVLHWAGRPAKLPRYPVSGATSITSWLAGLSSNSSSWIPFASPNCIPVVGSVFYVESDSNSGNNHVGVLIHELIPGVWLTAEGGGGDGTECKFTWRRWGLGWDSRRLRGLWLPSLMDRVGAPPSAPSVALPTFPIVRLDPRRDVVKRWQNRLLIWDPHCLPLYGADGGYGKECSTATAKLQTVKGLPVNGDLVDLATWNAAT